MDMFLDFLKVFGIAMAALIAICVIASSFGRY
jgi:hypothetical protein